MKRTYRFVRSTGSVPHVMESHETVQVPIFPGILKHPTVDELPSLLRNPEVVRKYTVQALRKAPWPILREFPPGLLQAHFDEADVRPGRASAIIFLLSGSETGDQAMTS